MPIWVGMMRFGLLLGATWALVDANRRLRRRNAELGHARDRAERLARVDALTGLPNRRHFDQALAGELARAGRTGEGLGVLLIDVDLFKQVNDRYGHAAGDRVLVEVAARLDRAMRGYDTVARWGGDEFAVIAPDVPDGEALAAIAEQLRRAVGDASVAVAGADLRVTISVGAVRLAGERFTPDEVIGVADRALADAKAAGRRRASAGPGEPASATY